VNSHEGQRTAFAREQEKLAARQEKTTV